MDVVGLLMPLLSGALGGTAAERIGLSGGIGFFGGALVGLIGGGIGGQIVSAYLGLAQSASSSSPDAGVILGQVVASGLSGAVCATVVGCLVRRLSRP